MSVLNMLWTWSTKVNIPVSDKKLLLFSKIMIESQETFEIAPEQVRILLDRSKLAHKGLEPEARILIYPCGSTEHTNVL